MWGVQLLPLLAIANIEGQESRGLRCAGSQRGPYVLVALYTSPMPILKS